MKLKKYPYPVQKKTICITGFLLFVFLSPVFTNLLAQSQFPTATGFVNDFAGVVPASYATQMEAICQEVKQKTGVVIAVATVKSVGDMDYTEYAGRLFEEWKIGEAGKDNGILLFTTVGERRVRIEVGYGLEGDIPDITAGQILDEYVVPELRRNQWGPGLLAGVQAIAGVIARANGVEITGSVQPRVDRQRNSRRGGGLGSLIFYLILFLFFSRLGPWFLPLLLGGGFRSSRWNRRGGGFGGGFGGGGFGGGFGGFGGGASGGGGAGRGF